MPTRDGIEEGRLKRVGAEQVDVSKLKRKEKDLEELMAEINASEAARGVPATDGPVR